MEGNTNTGVDSAVSVPPLSRIPPSSSSIEPSSIIAKTGNNTSRKRGPQLLGPTKSESLKMERDRRLKMAKMFTQLQTTVPGVFPQATREVIINETIRYIKDLEKKKQRLEELKESMKPLVEGSLMVPPCDQNNRMKMNCAITVSTTAVSSNVVFFGIQSVAQHGLVTVILKVFCKHQAEVLAANVSVNHGKLILAVTALVQNGSDGNSTIEKIKREIMNL